MKEKGYLKKKTRNLVTFICSLDYFIITQSGGNLMSNKHKAQPKDSFTKDEKILRDNLGLAKDISEVLE